MGTFDSVANQYDNTFSNTAIGKAQREIVWEYLRKKKFANKNILELNCGTGIDAVFLAQNNIVIATDASQEMLQLTADKILENALQNSCKTLLWDLNTPFPGSSNLQYDLIFSNFGGLNCLSPDALTKLSATLNKLLKPGGKIIVVVMGRKCIWEKLYYILKGNIKSAYRRSNKQATTARIGVDTFVETWYFSPAEISQCFTSEFKYCAKRPVGLFIPPSYMESYFKKKQALLRLLIQLDKLTANVGLLSNYADHFLLELEKH